MKVTLYAVRSDHEISYIISLDMQVDLDHLSSCYPNATVYQMEPPISLGTAVILQEKLNEITSNPSRSPTRRSASPTKQWIDLIRSKAEECNISSQLVQQIYFRKINLQPPTDSLLLGHSISIDHSIARLLNQHLQGRALLHEELMDLLSALDKPHLTKHWRSYIQHLYLNHDIELVNGISCKRKQKSFFFSNQIVYECRRCGSGRDQMYWTYCESCERDCPYCEECLNMGRTRFCSMLINGIRSSVYPSQRMLDKTEETRNSISKWKLSKPQQEAASSGLNFLENSIPVLKWDKQSGTMHKYAETTHKYARTTHKQALTPPCFLIWAVTGAGKTEMIFPLIEAELKRGGKVLVATPRKDVVLELQPRLDKAFANHKLITLYGGSHQRWETGDLTLATTHQMIRFWRRFDLIIIDEIDAFPFHLNAMLEYAVQKACSSNGRYILLSATPPANLQKAAQRNKLQHVKVSVRFHGYPLPVPKQMRMTSFKIKHDSNESRITQTQPIPHTLHLEIMDSLQKGAQIFIFVPQIRLMAPLLSQFRSQLKDVVIEGTSSKDPDRTEKVQQFRQGHIRVLITTTILERGVTVPKTDVLILNADSAIYNESALIQMAGRSGRSPVDPVGKVCFVAQDKTLSQVRAIKQIKDMNRLARKKGYLVTS